jgi:hypothetical protein
LKSRLKVNQAGGTDAAIRYPLSAIRYPLSAIRYPLSAIRYPLSAILIILVFSINFDLNATTVLRLNIDSIINESSVVIEGDVIEVVNDEGGEEKIPTTTYNICSVNVLIGSYEQNCLVLRVPGGRRGNGYSGYVGMPKLLKGKRYILFLTNQERWNSPFTGWWQGVYQIVDTTKGPVVLSHDGQAVKNIDENGFLITSVNANIIETPIGIAEHVDGLNETNHMTFAIRPITHSFFVNYLQNTIQQRAARGLRIPAGFPATWRCNDGISTPVTDSPRVLNEEEMEQ